MFRWAGALQKAACGLAYPMHVYTMAWRHVLIGHTVDTVTHLCSIYTIKHPDIDQPIHVSDS